MVAYLGKNLIHVCQVLLTLIVAQTEAGSRSTQLVQLHIQRCKLLVGKGDTDIFIENLADYFKRFGHSGSFILEINALLEGLDQDVRSRLLQKFQNSKTDGNFQALGQSITVLKLQSLSDNISDLSVKDLEGRVVQIATVFLNGLPLSKDLDSIAQKNHDELLSLAFNILSMLFRRTDDIGYILESAMLMELGTRTTRNEMLYRCSLVRLYFYWNSLLSAYECYKSLDVEDILLEPISQEIISEILASLPWEGLTNFLCDCMKFMDHQIFLCGETASHFFHNMAYLQAMGQLYFKDKLQRSVMYAILRMETPISKLKQDSCDINKFEGTLEAEGLGIPSLELADEMATKSLVFSKDLNKQHPWMAPTSDETYIFEALEGGLHWQLENMAGDLESALHQRPLLPRLIYLSLHSTSTSTFIKQLIHVDGKSDDSLLQELKTLLERYAKPLGLPINDAIQLLVKVNFGCKPKELEPHLLPWMAFAVFVNAWNISSGEIHLTNRDPSVFIFWHLTINLLKRCIDEAIDSAKPLTFCGATFFRLTQLVSEPLSWHALIIQSSIKSLLLEKKRADTSSIFESDPLFYLLLADQLKGLAESIVSALMKIIDWITEEAIKTHEDRLKDIASKIEVKDGKDGPGKVAQVLDRYMYEDIDARTLEALNLCTGTKEVERVLNAQDASLSEFGKLCKAKKQRLEEFIKEFILQSGL